MKVQHRRRLSKPIIIPTVSSPTGKQWSHARRMTMHFPPSAPDTTYMWGYALLCATAVMFFSTMYAMIGSKFMPDTHNKILDWIKHDKYYCLLAPITAIVGIYFVVCNWMGMKFFRHN